LNTKYKKRHKTVVYEYLSRPELQHRFHYVKGLLDWTDKDIVELNCGQNPIYHHIKDTGFKSYLCNDLYTTPPNLTGDNVTFLPISDETFTDTLTRSKEEINTLICFGVVDGNKTRPDIESPTLQNSIIRLTNTFKPHDIVLETSTKWNNYFHVIDKLVTQLTKYNVKSQINISPIGNFDGIVENELYNRTITHLTTQGE
jgi:hypothetical protein